MPLQNRPICSLNINLRIKTDSLTNLPKVLLMLTILLLSLLSPNKFFSRLTQLLVVLHLMKFKVVASGEVSPIIQINFRIDKILEIG